MKKLIEELLYEEEGTTLDYKSEQYKFSNVTDFEKCELLKDILAFANSWRRTDAYILIGVKEVKGGRSEVIGGIDHIDDAQLQQFVNQKTQRPIDFHYVPVELEGKQIAIIKIGPQERPIYLKNDFGNLKKNAVYIRRGSSTDIASLDEVSKMGTPSGEAYTKAPKLIFGFANLENHQKIGEKTNIKTTILNIEDQSSIPDYGDSGVKVGQFFSMNMPDYTKNKNYYRELANYYIERFYVGGIGFYLYNEGGVTASAVNIELRIENKNNLITILEESQLPSRPNEDNFGLGRYVFPGFSSNSSKIEVKRIGVDYLVNLYFEKVQPKQTVFPEYDLFFGATTDVEAAVNFSIYSDNLPVPLTGNLYLKIEVGNKSINYKQILNCGK